VKNVVVKKNHSYSGARRMRGSSYPAYERDIPILIRMGYVEMDEKAVVKKPPPPDEALSKRTRNGRFRRRDAEADE